MAKSSFSGPISVGSITTTTGTTIDEDISNSAYVLCAASFPFDHNDFTITADDDRIAVVGSNGASTTSVTLVDATQNVPGITASHGFDAASAVQLTSAGNDSARTATITGTDVGGYAQSEDVTMGNAGAVYSTKTFKTISSISVDGSGTAGTLKVGIALGNNYPITIMARSKWNHYPNGESTVGNLANNIVFPKYSRIMDCYLLVHEAFDTAGFDVSLGSFINTSGTVSHDLDYFAGDADNDVKSVGHFGFPVNFDQSLAQSKNCLNVNDDDTAAYEIDKPLTITARTDDALTTGEACIHVTWLQAVNK